MKKNYSFMIIIFLLSFLIFIPKTYASNFTSLTINSSNCASINLSNSSDLRYFVGNNNCDNPNANFLGGQGQGNFIFTFYYESPGTTATSPIYQISVVTHNNINYVCDINNHTWYSDNHTQYDIITANCPIYIGADDYLNRYAISRTGSAGSVKYRVGTTGTFIPVENTYYSTNVNQEQVTQAIQNSQQATITEIQYFKHQAHDDAVQGNANTNEIKNNTKETNDLIKSENVSGAESSADDLKNNSAFQDNTGLSAIISMPLTFVNSLTNTCQPINLTIPYMDADVSIPCMQSVITNKMPLLANLIKIVINGFIVYRILLDIFQIVRNAKNPEDDRIEVLDL